MSTARTEISVRLTPRGQTLVVRRRPFASALLSVLFVSFLITWTGGCMLQFGRVGQGLRPANIFDAALFLRDFGVALALGGIWVLVLFLVAVSAFSFEQIRVGPDGFDFRQFGSGFHFWFAQGNSPQQPGGWAGLRDRLRGLPGAVLPRFRRIPLEDLRGVVRYSWALGIESTGEPIVFGHGMRSIEVLRLAERIRKHVGTLLPGRSLPVRDCAGFDELRVEVLHPTATAAESPPGGVIRGEDRGDHLALFRREGYFDPNLFVILTLFNVFWNGTVYMLLKSSGDWPLAFHLFFSAHVAGGCLLFGAWLDLLAAPTRWQTWTVRPHAIAVRSSVLGLHWTRHYEFPNLDRVELWESFFEAGRFNPMAGPPDRGRRGWSLALVGDDGREPPALENLTEDEARWAGGLLGRWLNASWGL
jgi:hypothetical protein